MDKVILETIAKANSENVDFLALCYPEGLKI